MRVGLIARADKTGLGVQTWSFWKNMKPDHTLVVDLSRCSGQNPNMSMYAGDPNVTVWQSGTYPGVEPVPDHVIETFLDKVDVVFTCETPYNTWLFQRAKEKGVRTVLQPNYEFLEYVLLDNVPEPDVFALPSMWHVEDIKRALPGRNIVYLPVPVDRELLPFTPRTELKTILHTAGTPALEDRNGSLLLIDAMRYVRTPVRCVIRTQKHLHAPFLAENILIDHRPFENFWDLYGNEDLYVIPRKFGGLCLPMQEAMSVGMPVLMTDIPPQSEFMPKELLVHAHGVKQVMTRAPIWIHETTPEELAARIDWLYENPELFEELSYDADKWATQHSWEALTPVYRKVLEG